MSTKREVFRHRNSSRANAWLADDMIHTFWVGQRVVRSWERRNYVDQIGQVATVVGLPEKGSAHPVLTVVTELEDGSPDEQRTWTVGEATPLRVLLQRNARRLRDVALAHSKALSRLDRDGQLLSKTATAGKRS